MNLTIREVISQVKNSNKFVNADSRVTNKYIYSLLKKHRDWMIKRTADKFELYQSDYIFQTWECVDLEEVSAIECCNVKTKCTLYRTKKKLPPLIMSTDGVIIRNVFSLDGSVEIFPIKESEWIRKMNNPDFLKYNKELFYFYKDDYLYFPNLTWKKLKVEGYFTEDISIYNYCRNEGKCKPFLDNEFRIPRQLLAECLDNVNKELLNYYQRFQSEDQVDKNETRKS